MNWKKWLAMGCVMTLCAALAGCGDNTKVYVQSVEVLASQGGIAPGDRFSGLVVSEHVTQIKKDDDKTVAELLVKEGDDVKQGHGLFSYETEELQLTLDKQRLEVEQLNASIENYKSEIKSLERERDKTGGTTRLQYTVQIQTAQVDLKEAELKLKTKESEVAKSEELLANATVTSPVDGRVQAISEEGATDNNGKPLPYITIQQIGSYRVKGILGELQRGAVAEGSRMRLISRTDDNQTWTGTVTLVDYENPSQGSDYDRYYGMSSNEMTSSSKYPFYVELDSTDGLILGQHLYLEILTEEGQTTGPSISAAFVCYNEDGSAYVWAENRGKLEKRDVVLGEYNPLADTQEIAEGLSLEDYIAFPDMSVCQEGAPTTREAPVQSAPEEAVAAEGGVA